MMNWEFTDNSDKAKQAMRNAINKALYEAGAKAERDASKRLKDNDSVKSGDLQRSISHRVDAGSNSVTIGTALEYGPYVEFGTKRQKPRHPKPWLFAAMKAGRTRYRNLMKKEIKNIMESSDL